jgi:RNA-directed DNA polymerase
VNDKDAEAKSTAVPGEREGAKQVEETDGRWLWVERSVWSERMLQTLETGVRGGKWFSLIDKVWKKDNLGAAWQRAFRNGGSAGIDGQSIERFTANLNGEVERLHRD